MTTESVLIAVLVAVLAEAGAVTTLLAEGLTVEAGLLSVGILLTAAGGAIARARSTPVADPKLDADTPLIPAPKP